MGDDVVQLGRDPGLLVADGQRRMRLAFLLQLAYTLGELGGDALTLTRARAPRPTPAAGTSSTGTAASLSASATPSSSAPAIAASAASPAHRVSRRPAQKAWAAASMARPNEGDPNGTDASSAGDGDDPRRARMQASGTEGAADDHRRSDARGAEVAFHGRQRGAEHRGREADEQVGSAHAASQATASSGSETTASARPPWTVASTRAALQPRPFARALDRRLGLPASGTRDGELEVRRRRTERSTSNAGRVVQSSQQLLDDAVGRQLDGGGQHARVALDGQPHVARPWLARAGHRGG